ncbi:MAG: sensor histidine kinase, partial [Candidatus Cryptobacteroides sp.]
KCTKTYQKVIGIVFNLLFVAFLVWFCYISIYKVLVYTHINLHLYKIWSLSLETFVVYLAIFALIFSIAELLDLLQPLWMKLFKKKVAIFSVPGLILYSVLCSFLCVACTSTIGFQREKVVVASWAESLANARDYELEAHMRKVERQISRDEVIARASDSDEAFAAAKARLIDRYFFKFMNAYDLILKVGRNEKIVGLDDGVQIETGSRFRFAPISDLRSRYVAAFQYYSYLDGQKSVYLILEPKYPNKRSLSMILSDRSESEVPIRYSYAMYKDRNRQYMKGSYAFPLKLTEEYYDEILKKGELHFQNNGYDIFATSVGEGEIIVMSRPQSSIWIGLITTVFLALVFIFLMLLMVKRPKRKRINFEKSYFKRTIQYVLLVSMLVSMSTLASVSITFVNERSDASVNRMMSDKVNTIRFQLQNGIRALDSPDELTSREMLDLLRAVGDNTGSDISLYRVDGKMVMSTIPELHERHILGYRMPQIPFYHLKYQSEGYCINKENLGDRIIYMLYAPVVGADGKVLAFFASPYTDSGRNYSFDAVLHTFSVIVVFIILLIFASVSVTFAIDKTLKPLSEMSRKMRSGKMEKLNTKRYRDDSEITDIVNSYNRMVEDLSNSTKALAQAERDKAWSEMARNVAHEIKNPLTPMQLQIQRVQRLKAMGDSSWVEKFDSMAEVLLDHINVLTETANQFSDFAKLYSEDPVEVSLDDMLREEVSLFDNRPGLEFVYLGLPDVKVKAPRPQLIRVFVNLLNNAVQACEGQPDSRIEVSLRNGADPDYYEIVFEDSGAGVDESNIDKLFTPKFTTKSSGSGLGLSICKSILEKCGASISYSRSFRLGGACFTILYPKS